MSSASERSEGPSVLLVAGEASGDLRGAELLEELRRRSPGLRARGMGGERLRAAGLEIEVDAGEVSTMGFTEVVGRLGSVLRSYRRLRRLLLRGDERGRRPDLAVLIDLPDFNLRLARIARRAGVPVLYYVSPQVWAWRRYRVRTLARRVDHLAVVFPFEAEIYRGLTDVTFVGHPALETVRPTRSREEVRSSLGVADSERLVVLLPGSRPAELRALLPPMLGALARLGEGVRGAVALADERLRPLVREGTAAPLPALSGATYDLVAAADLVLTASGSATLETALLGTPMVILYRLSALSFALARLLVRVPHIGMPNLILGERVVPELVQGDASPERIAAEARPLLFDRDRAERMRQALGRVRARLGEPGAAARTAEIAVRMLARGPLAERP